jgi:hypothetical protein
MRLPECTQLSSGFGLMEPPATNQFRTNVPMGPDIIQKGTCLIGYPHAVDRAMQIRRSSHIGAQSVGTGH